MLIPLSQGDSPCRRGHLEEFEVWCPDETRRKGRSGAESLGDPWRKTEKDMLPSGNLT